MRIKANLAIDLSSSLSKQSKTQSKTIFGKKKQVRDTTVLCWLNDK